MITGLTEEQYDNLPVTSLQYPCDKCEKRHDYGSLMRDIADYSLADGEITAKPLYTALYLCSGCHWQMSCEYSIMERARERQQQQIASNEARWLQKLAGLSIQELARLVGVSRQAYHKWLLGKTITPEHKDRLKELIAVYVQDVREAEEDDGEEAYFAVGFTFVDRGEGQEA